ncbi:MAG: helix-turn-helix domain-containing protein, partial [Myxococcota bacterium]
GHIDLAWSYSFQDVEKFRNQERHRRFQPVLRDMARGHRVGRALKNLFESRSEVQSELITAADAAARSGDDDLPGDRSHGRDHGDPARLGHRWMLHQSLDSYILLGDPAVRLGVAEQAIARYRQAARAAAAAAGSGAAIPSVRSAPAAPAPAPAAPALTVPDGMSADDVAEAAREVIVGDESLKALAAKYGVTRGELTTWERIYDEAGRAALRRALGEDER